jgi:hypothetical protein
MLNGRLGSVLVILSVTAAVWGCADDDEPSPGAGGGNTAGTAETGGGGDTAGSAGEAGSSAGGIADQGGTAGTGGVGSQGGEAGDTPGGAGGEGGEGGNLSLPDACSAICADQMPLACDIACVESCTGLATETDAPTEYAALVQCEATLLGPSDYTCHDQAAPGAPDQAGPAFNGPCDTELCAWTCAESLFYEENTRAYCGC